MDYTKIRSFIQERNIPQQQLGLTDLELILKDNSREIILYVHKIILISSCKYFDRLFAFNDLNELTLEVSNATVAKDVVLSLYHKKLYITTWPYALSIISIQDYFGLNTSLPDLKITGRDFEIFLEVCNIVGFDDKNLALVKLHMPENYDLEKLSPDLIKELIKREDCYKIISGSWDHAIRIWSLSDNTPLEPFKKLNYPIYCLAITSDNKYIVSCGTDYHIHIWGFETGAIIHVLKGHRSCVQTLAITPNDKYIISGSWDETIKIWDIKSGSLIKILCGHKNTIYTIVPMSDNKRFISGTKDEKIEIWDIETAENIHTINNDSGLRTNIVLTPCDKHIVFGDSDFKIKIWDLEKLSEVKFIQDDSELTCIAVGLNNLYIVSSNVNSVIKIWNFTTGLLINVLEGQYMGIYSISILDKMIISGSGNNCIKVWDLETGKLIKTFKRHKNVVSTIVAIRYDSKYAKKLGLREL